MQLDAPRYQSNLHILPTPLDVTLVDLHLDLVRLFLRTIKKALVKLALPAHCSVSLYSREIFELVVVVPTKY